MKIILETQKDNLIAFTTGRQNFKKAMCKRFIPT